MRSHERTRPDYAQLVPDMDQTTDLMEDFGTDGKPIGSWRTMPVFSVRFATLSGVRR